MKTMIVTLLLLFTCPLVFAEDVPSAPMPVPARPARTENDHPFFDFKNSMAIGAFSVSLAGDSLSTQRLLDYPGYRERNPIARPFVGTRAGMAVYSGGSLGIMMGGMYLAHKTHHHKLERIIPFAMAGWEGFATAWNYHYLPQARANAAAASLAKTR
jgi:hypothetical protein